MATTYDIDVSGLNGVPDPVTPINGIDGPPLGPDGNGAPGEADWLGFHCKRPAGPGKPGNPGFAAPSAKNGANGQDAYSVVITCAEYHGTTLNLLNNGGTGANGNDAGHGGSGSDGGNAGHQPSACTQTINGGIGGDAGNGGDAGSGGDAGNSSTVSIVYGPGFSTPPVSVMSQGGKGGDPGAYGSPGQAGNGGLDSQQSPASSGQPANYGKQGTIGKSGSSGGVTTRQDKTQPSLYLQITTVTNTSH